MRSIARFTAPGPEAKAVLAAMNRALGHRGPDGSGIFVDRGIALGHTRLAIIDLAGGAQQRVDAASGDALVVFNGEIHGYRELADELRQSRVTRRCSASRAPVRGRHLPRRLLLQGQIVDPNFYHSSTGSSPAAGELNGATRFPGSPRWRENSELLVGPSVVIDDASVTSDDFLVGGRSRQHVVRRDHQFPASTKKRWPVTGS